MLFRSFHATTGYSFPNAIRLAEELARAPSLSSKDIASLIEKRSRQTWKTQAIFRFLNRSMFLAANPSERIRILDRFYAKLPTSTIERFYAGHLRKTDIALLIAVMATKPPIGVLPALKCMSETSSWEFAAKHHSTTSELG